MLAVAPLGPAPGAVLTAMEDALAAAFRLPVQRLAALDEPAQAFVAQRGQWSSVAFLQALLACVPPGAARLLGVTERDLFVPVLSFVYGQAQLGGTVAVVSLARLRPEFHGLPEAPAVLARRAATEAVHELGHTLRARALPRPPLPDVALDRPARPRRQERDALRRLRARSSRGAVRCSAPARERKETAHEGPLAHPGRGRRRGDDRVARRLAARGRLHGRHRRLGPRGDREGARARVRDLLRRSQDAGRPRRHRDDDGDPQAPAGGLRASSSRPTPRWTPRSRP